MFIPMISVYNIQIPARGVYNLLSSTHLADRMCNRSSYRCIIVSAGDGQREISMRHTRWYKAWQKVEKIVVRTR